MKYLIILLLIGFSSISVAQNQGNRMKMTADFTPEQRAIIKTKKMTLALELNSSQQNQILEINKNNVLIRQKEREAHIAMKKNGNKPSSEDRFKMMNNMLDLQIEYQEKIKTILDNKQYELWKEIQRLENWKMKKKHVTAKNKMHKKTP